MMPTPITAVLSSLTKSFQEATQERTPNLQARRKRFQVAVDALNHADRALYEQHIQMCMQLHRIEDFFNDCIDNEYLERFPEDKPVDPANNPASYQMGKFHQVINNSLYSLDAYAQGFIGCLIGSTFIGAGTMLGVFIRQAIKLSRQTNVPVLSSAQMDMMKAYIALKLQSQLADRANPQIVKSFFTMMGLKNEGDAHESRDAFLDAPWVQAQYSNIPADQKTIAFLQLYEAHNPWTQGLCDSLQKHVKEQSGALDPNKSQAFALSLAITLSLVFHREQFQDKDGDAFLKRYVKALLTPITDDNLRNRLWAQCFPPLDNKNLFNQLWGRCVDPQSLCPLDIDTVADLEDDACVTSMNAVLSNDLIVNAQNQALIFSKPLQQIQLLAHDLSYGPHKSYRSLMHQGAIVLKDAVVEGASAMVMANYRYLKGDEEQQSDRHQHAQLSQRPRPAPRRYP